MKSIILGAIFLIATGSINLFGEHSGFKPLNSGRAASDEDKMVVGKSEADKSVTWGYNVKYQQGISSEKLKALRQTLKSKGVKILYPADKDWQMPTGYLSVTTYLDDGELQGLSSDIQSVEPQEQTKRYSIQMLSGLTPAQVKKVRDAFTKNRIQVTWNPPVGAPPYYAVKTTLTADQIKAIKEIAPFIEAVESQN